MAIFVQALPAKRTVTGIVCMLLEPSSGRAMVGVPIEIAFALSRPGTVTVKLGAAALGSVVVSGAVGSFLWTPGVGNVGDHTIGVVAVDAVNGTIDSDTLDVTVVAAAVFPGTVTPLAWLNGAALTAYSDAGGTTPVSAPNGRARRFNDVSPLTGNWQTPAANLARRDPSSISLEPTPTGSYPLQYSGMASGINLNDSTWVVSWVARGPFYTHLYAGTPNWGDAVFQVYANGTAYPLTGFAETKGARHTMVIRWSATTVKARLLTNGVQTASITITPGGGIAGGTTNATQLYVGLFQSCPHAAVVEEIVVNRNVSDGEEANLVAYADSIPAVAAFPLHRPLVTLAGDSIVAGNVAGVAPYDTWAFTLLRNLRSGYDAEIANVGIVGAGSSGLGAYTAPYYDARRVNNVALLAVGTNDLATGVSASTSLTNYWASLASIRAQGYQVVACTMLPRSGLFGGGMNETSFEAARALWNADILANWSTRADALADVTTLPMGAAGASHNATYYTVDEVHPTAVGHAALETVYQPAIASLLAA